MSSSDPLRILHVASFSGNIGDNANHLGFRPWLEHLAGRAVVWTDLEMREFYWRERQWDDSFVALANAHDALVIGGGNYFELWVESSPTGTSVAIAPETFARLAVPVFFNALGVDPGQGVPEVSRARFTAFLDTLLATPRHLVSVRNDGASDALRTHIGAAYGDAVTVIPDGGFFVPPGLIAAAPGPRPRIAINVAGDMAELRFAGFDDPIEGFARECASALSDIATRLPQHDIVLVPHIFRDLDVIARIIAHLGDRLRRTRLLVAAYGSGDAVALDTLGLYRSCDLVLAMRFHANVCPIGMGVPTLALNCYRQIEMLYDELGQRDRLIDVSAPGFAAPLAEAAARAIHDPGSFSGGPSEACAQVGALRARAEPQVRRWLDGVTDTARRPA